MKFIVDECTGPNVAKWLAQQGNDVYSVADSAFGISDEEVLQKAVAEQRMLITNDKDFGELIFKQRLSHAGVILMRLDDESSPNKIAVLEKFFGMLNEELSAEHYIVLTESAIRINKIR